MTRWHCRVCRTWGLGGPNGWQAHWTAQHAHNGRYSAAVSFGFSPNYSNGNGTDWIRSRWARPARCEGGDES